MKALCQEDRGHGLRIAPLIDIVFLLLIFFLVATTFYEEEKDMTIALAAATEGENREHSDAMFIVNVRESGIIVVKQRVKTLSQLEEEIGSARDGDPDLVVVIRCDRGTPHRHFVRILNLCEKLKVGSVAVATFQTDE